MSTNQVIPVVGTDRLSCLYCTHPTMNYRHALLYCVMVKFMADWVKPHTAMLSHASTDILIGQHLQTQVFR